MDHGKGLADARPTTEAQNARLWGARARDWAEAQEAAQRSLYVAVHERAGVGPGSRLLDAGCGAGMAAAMAAGRGAVVSGIDAAAAMIAVARERVPSGDFRAGDLQALPFADSAFDIVTGFNAFQFAADPVAALAEARRVVRPGGTVAVVVWGPPEGMPAAAAVVGALRHLLPPPPPGAPGPFALSQASALAALAEAAGLEAGACFDIDAPFLYPDSATALRGLCAAGTAERARDVAGAAAVEAAYGAAIAPFVQPDGRVSIGASFRCLMSRRAA